MKAYECYRNLAQKLSATNNTEKCLQLLQQVRPIYEQIRTNGYNSGLELFKAENNTAIIGLFKRLTDDFQNNFSEELLQKIRSLGVSHEWLERMVVQILLHKVDQLPYEEIIK